MVGTGFQDSGSTSPAGARWRDVPRGLHHSNTSACKRDGARGDPIGSTAGGSAPRHSGGEAPPRPCDPAGLASSRLHRPSPARSAPHTLPPPVPPTVSSLCIGSPYPGWACGFRGRVSARARPCRASIGRGLVAWPARARLPGTARCLDRRSCVTHRPPTTLPRYWVRLCLPSLFSFPPPAPARHGCM